MSKLGSGFDKTSYATVAERVRLFYSAHPLGRIETQLVERTEREIVFKALVFRGAHDELPGATGWAAERVGDSEINAVACLENTETSAVGRALANLGFTAARERPSQEEMAKSARARLGFRTTPDSGPGMPNEYPTRELHLPSRDGLASFDEDPLQRDAAIIVDALALVRTATRLGLRRVRSDRLRQQLLDGTIAAERREPVMSVLRRWIEKRRRETLRNPYPV
ncbi:MAG TPA: hypothetical protein VGJ18_06355 [Gemmatimonadaceae bacterium]